MISEHDVNTSHPRNETTICATMVVHNSPRSPLRPSLSRRRKTIYLSALIVFVLIAYKVNFNASMSSRRHLLAQYPYEINSTSHPRVLFKETASPDKEPKTEHVVVPSNMASRQFLVHSGFFPETHPSQPYFVRIDDTGSHLETIEYGVDDHPLSRLVDSRELRAADQESVFFFVVPKANGGKIKTIMTKCFNVRRSEKREDPESSTFIGGVLNIDTQTIRGLAKARSNHIIESGLVDAFATSYFFEGMLLFKTSHRGRAFTVLQHPVHRAESLYESRAASSEDMEIADYLESPKYIDNWVVRSLTNNKRGELNEEHVMVAKGILASKFFVGISDYLEETIKRLEIYYGWSEDKSPGCVETHFKKYEKEKNPHMIERGSDEWNLITDKDNFDLMLYYYALELFAKQGSTMFHRPYVDKEGVPIDFAELARQKKLQEALLEQFLGGV